MVLDRDWVFDNVFENDTLKLVEKLEVSVFVKECVRLPEMEFENDEEMEWERLSLNECVMLVDVEILIVTEKDGEELAENDTDWDGLVDLLSLPLRLKLFEIELLPDDDVLPDAVRVFENVFDVVVVFDRLVEIEREMDVENERLFVNEKESESLLDEVNDEVIDKVDVYEELIVGEKEIEIEWLFDAVKLPLKEIVQDNVGENESDVEVLSLLEFDIVLE